MYLKTALPRVEVANREKALLRPVGTDVSIAGDGNYRVEVTDDNRIILVPSAPVLLAA